MKPNCTYVIFNLISILFRSENDLNTIRSMIYREWWGEPKSHVWYLIETKDMKMKEKLKPVWFEPVDLLQCYAVLGAGLDQFKTILHLAAVIYNFWVTLMSRAGASKKCLVILRADLQQILALKSSPVSLYASTYLHLNRRHNPYTTPMS